MDCNLEVVVSDFGTTRLLNPKFYNQTLIAGIYGYIASEMGRATVSSKLYKLEFFTIGSGFLSHFGVDFRKKMSEYSDPMDEKLELIEAQSFFIQTLNCLSFLLITIMKKIVATFRRGGFSKAQWGHMLG